MARGAAFATRVEGILTRLGGAFGEGQLTGTLTRVTGTTGPAYAPTGETTEDHDFVCLWGEFTQEERLTGLIEDNERQLLIGTDTLDTAPKAGDKVTVQGVTYDVKMVDDVRPAGVSLLYIVKVAS